jgi:MoxR-like ATPase
MAGIDYIMHDEAKLALSELERGKHVLLIGPHGSGKTHFARKYAEYKGQNIDTLPCDKMMDTNAMYTTLSVVDGMWVSLPGPLVSAAENGNILSIKEFSALNANSAHFIHEAANNEPISVRTEGNRQIIPHPDFRIIADMNGTAYAGNYRLSPATYDRFTVIPWPYPSNIEEVKLLQRSGPKAPTGKLRELVEAAAESRKQAALNIMPPISTRALQDIAAMLDYGADYETAVYYKLCVPVKMSNPEQYEAFSNHVIGNLELDPVTFNAIAKMPLVGAP